MWEGFIVDSPFVGAKRHTPIGSLARDRLPKVSNLNCLTWINNPPSIALAA